MKSHKFIFSLAALVAVGATACKDSEPGSQAAVPEVRGEAIGSIAPVAPVATPAQTHAAQADTAPAGVLTSAAELVKPEKPVTPILLPESVATEVPPPAKPTPLPTADPVKVTEATATALTPKIAEVATSIAASKTSVPKSASPAPVSPTVEVTKPAPVKQAPSDSAGIARTEKPKPASEKKTEPVKEVIEMDGEYRVVGFEKLASFEFEVPEEEYDPDKKPEPTQQPDQIPTDVKALDKKSVAVKGFMLPLKVEDGEITELLIMRDQSMCCYGTVPKINEWVSVKMVGKGVKPILDQAVTIYGKLKVGEMRENGYLIGIYEMDGEKLVGPLDF